MSDKRLDCKMRKLVSEPAGPWVSVAALMANWALMSPTTVLYSVTKLSMELVIWFASGATDSVTGVAGSALVRVKVTSGIAPVTVLVVLAYGTPLIEMRALVPPTGGSQVRLVVLVLVARAPALPVDWLVIARRAPLASVITVAVMPHLLVALSELIDSASVASVSLLPAVMGMSAVVPPAPPI